MLKYKVQDKQCDERLQNVVKCRVKIYKITNMQRCPYIHEMKERLLGEQLPGDPTSDKLAQPPQPLKMDQQQLLPSQQPVATIVKLNPDGYGSHTSPTHHRVDRTPLMPKQPEDDFQHYYTKTFPKNAKTSLFIIMSFVYAKLLVVVCVAYVISDVVTHNIPLYYYEGFFTYLYGMSILFLLYVFCFLLQESACCSGNEKEKKVKPPPKQKSKEKEKERKKEEEKKKKEEKEKQKMEEKQKKQKEKEKEKEKDKKSKKQEKSTTYRRNSEGVVDAEDVVPVPVAELSKSAALRHQSSPVVSQGSQPQPQPQEPPSAVPPPPVLPPSAPVAGHPVTNNVDLESGVVVQQVPPTREAQQVTTKSKCKRKTTQNDHSHGSFFLRIGAIAFGLGTMIYNGLEFGSFFEVPFTSPCYMILRGVNPVLQMIFTFMQMYFIFMNSRLNIHRFKVVARFGLMHVVATNICVWIRTLVLEYIKEITLYHHYLLNDTTSTEMAPFAESIRQHTLRNANTVLGTHVAKPDVITTSTTASSLLAAVTTASTPASVKKFVTTTARNAYPIFNNIITTTTTLPPTTTRNVFTTVKTIPTAMFRIRTTVAPPTTTTTTTTLFPFMMGMRTTASKMWRAFTTASTTTFPATTPTTPRTHAPTTHATLKHFFDFGSFDSFMSNDVASVAEEPELLSNDLSHQSSMLVNNNSEILDNIMPQALIKYFNQSLSNDSCGRINIMGTIVQDSAPYLFPFIIEYSLIGAAVIYVMWKHIGRNPRFVTQEDLEHRLEIMLSRRAVAMAQAQQGRVDCVGASKGLFFGLLMLVGSLICLILFFVLIRNPELGLLAIYLADVSHCVLMVLSILAIIIGFIRVQGLKFKTEEQSDLNDILLRVSAFGLFTYAVFSVIAGHLNAFTKEPNLLVMITGILSVVQVILQLLFIADVSRRRVHLPEHDRTKPGRQVVTFLLICNLTMWIIYTFETQKVEANPVQKDFYGFLAWAIVQRITLPLCIFHRFHSAVTLAEIWKTSYKARLE
ncbi:proton channel OtopLc isoform X3 [Cylas formicarius]|uniref:proton channel OtopLc isoform X3 n=1 Tax=Cylas formicarius TaxID=197179 RepID=UPI002958C6BE|nr:proton channel OtopLc isoform X3 [Cylas formicarius]